ncbi:MAG: MarR family transcriptional regulator [Clostridiales bacterium]|jgi:DNA-binding MarR family transcriptional regulator|nr:MarR family transcriptional regulator [Clostridiales bacterium]
MLEVLFAEVYAKFKLNFYRRIFSRFETREASLTAVETFCVEVIHALDNPTIKEFANFVMISQANAAYKVQNLIRKGYVTKKRSEEDRREYTLSVTDKFYHYYAQSSEYMNEVMRRMRERFTDSEIKTLEYILETISNELMPEIPLKKKLRVG